MTTNITVDAHAGWDVEVIFEDMQPTPPGLERMGPAVWTKSTKIIPANTKETIAIWDTKRIAGIRELPRG
jgi:hypothetical protein